MLCELYRTSFLNIRHPIITRVCRESREVAFENGYIMGDDGDPSEGEWLPSNYVPDRWFSLGSDVVHLN